ncbi:hypothetical protein ACFVWR_07050 [Leifsonia sp. NPDC058292]|uniref:hypothetical protein n=1 Tax=Leifsonia sp. NPDC058292 TaxID=3346428 RepID=UPI0036D7F3F6
MTDTRPRRLTGLPEDPAVRLALMRRLIWGAALAVPASGLLVAAVLLISSALSYNPSYWEAQTPATFLGSVASWFWLGAPYGFATASGAALALLLFTVRGGSRYRAGVAALGAIFGSLVAVVVVGGIQPWLAVFLGIPAGIIGSGLAAAYVAWADWASQERVR